jgi:hypothetical protein
MIEVIYFPDGTTQTIVHPDPITTDAVLTEIAFIILCQDAGGMTDNMLVACQDDPRCKAMWIKFKASTTLSKDNALVQSGLTSIAQYGYLPNGVAAVNAAWPVV